MNKQEWSLLLDSFTKTIGSTTSHQEICDTLDRLSDAIISGTPIPKQMLINIIPALLSLFDPKTFWCYKHTACFALNHIVRAFKEILKEINLYDSIVKTIVDSICDPKRELRDAVAQSLGVLSDVYGNDLVETITPRMVEISKMVKDYSHIEGLVMSIGYVVSNCPSISEGCWNSLTSILLEKSTTKDFGNYGRYIRYYSSTAIERITRKNNKWTELQIRDIQERIIKTLIIDMDFSTRRACSMLFESVASSLKLTSQEILDYLKTPLSTSPTWEGRHTVFLIMQKCSKLISAHPHEEYYKILDENLRSRPREGKIGFQANASSGLALVHISLLEKINDDDGDVKEEAKKVFEKYIKPTLDFMLQSGESYLLDCVSQSYQLVLSHPLYEPVLLSSIFESSQSSKQLGLLFKNKFHASMPIRNSSTILWRSLEEKKKLRGDMEQESSLEKMYVTLILSYFSKFLEDRRLDYEVVESVMKSMGYLFSKVDFGGGEQKLFLDETSMISVVNILMSESSSSSSRRCSEVTRSASLLALLELVKRDTNFFVGMMEKSGKMESLFNLLRSGLLDVFDETVSLNSLSVLGVILVHLQNEKPKLILDHIMLVLVFGYTYDDELKKRCGEICCLLLGCENEEEEGEEDEKNDPVKMLDKYFEGGDGLARFVRGLGSLSLFLDIDVEYDMKESVSKFCGQLIKSTVLTGLEGDGNTEEGTLEKLYEIVVLGLKGLNDEDLIPPFTELFAIFFGKYSGKLVDVKLGKLKELVAMGLHYLYEMDAEFEGTSLESIREKEAKSKGQSEGVVGHVRSIIGSVLEVIMKDEGIDEYWKEAMSVYEKSK